MKPLTVLIVAGVAVAGGYGIAHAFGKEEENPSDVLDLPQPTETECTSATDVWQASQSVLTDPNATAQGMRDAAKVLREWPDDAWCDDDARQTAQTAIVLLEARADTLEATPPGQTPPATTPSVPVPPLPFPFPGSKYYQGYGYCPEGAVLNMATGLCDYTPVMQMPPVFGTSGSCCAACERGDECEGCG